MHGKVGVVGYCFGGLLTWLAACELEGVSAASSYYGGGVAGEVDRTARCPVMMHFGELDAHIPMSDVDKVRAAQPDVDVFRLCRRPWFQLRSSRQLRSGSPLSLR